MVDVRDNFFSEFDYQKSLPELVNFIIQNRLKFISENVELLRVLIQEMLVDESTIKLFRSVLEGNQGIFNNVKKLQKNYPEINQSLTPEQIMRCVIGPLITFIGQQLLSRNGKSEISPQDLRLIQTQIIAGLTLKD